MQSPPGPTSCSSHLETGMLEDHHRAVTLGNAINAHVVLCTPSQNMSNSCSVRPWRLKKRRCFQSKAQEECPKGLGARKFRSALDRNSGNVLTCFDVFYNLMSGHVGSSDVVFCAVALFCMQGTSHRRSILIHNCRSRTQISGRV